MEYNTQRTRLHMPEYGRMIQSLVEYCKTLKTKKERTEMAEFTVDLITRRNPQLKGDEEGVHKSWDHFFILAGYELDIDHPYPIPSPEELLKRPGKLNYPSYDDEYKFYGKSILQLIDRAIALEEGDEKEALIQVIANNMKKAYVVYNKEQVKDEVIFKHLKRLSNNKLDLTNLDTLDKSKVYFSNNNNHRNKNYKNNNHSKRKGVQNYRNNKHR